jgi:septal ring factor EnvC (AmiA/AmiB activator)
MTTTVSITEEVKAQLVKIAADLQKKKGRRVDLNEAIEYLVSARREKRPDLLEKTLAAIPHHYDSDYKLLTTERRKDELRSKRRYGV